MKHRLHTRSAQSHFHVEQHRRTAGRARLCGFAPCALCVTTLLAGGCSDTGPDVDALGMPASFSPAEKVVRADNRTVRCNTVHSLTLPPSIVDRLNLPVDPETAVVSCSLQIVVDGAVRNLPAEVSGSATTLSGHTSPLEFKEVIEEETVSYIETFAMQSKVAVGFDITVVDPQTGAHYEVEFEQTAL